MTEDPKPKVDPTAPEADPKADPKPDPKVVEPVKTDPPKVEDPPKADPPKTEAGADADYKKRYEALLSKLEGNEEYVNELKQTYVEKLPEALHDHAKELPMTELKTLVALSEAIKVEFSDKLEKIDTRVAPIIKERDDIKAAEKKTTEEGPYTDEAWALVKARQGYTMGRPIPERVKDILGDDGLKKVRKELDEARKTK